MPDTATPETATPLRGSFNQQDAAETTAETAVQPRPPRSPSLKSLVVRPVPPSVVREVIVRDHYLHAMPQAARACFAVYAGDDGPLVGAAVITSGARQGHHTLHAASPQDVVTLARLWLSDAVPPNGESRVLGVILRTLRRETPWKLVFSYADPAAGHTGVIYQATGWLYLGTTTPDRYLRLSDGALHHARSVHQRYGTNDARHLRNTGIHAERVTSVGKHRYVYLLDPAWRWRLRDGAQPYPKAVRP